VTAVASWVLVLVVVAAVVGPSLVRVRPRGRRRRRGGSASSWLGRVLLVRVAAWLTGVDVPGK
jgi:hypothetical protein